MLKGVVCSGESLSGKGVTHHSSFSLSGEVNWSGYKRQCIRLIKGWNKYTEHGQKRKLGIFIVLRFSER